MKHPEGQFSALIAAMKVERRGAGVALREGVQMTTGKGMQVEAGVSGRRSSMNHLR
jgi:hypothetical protein